MLGIPPSFSPQSAGRLSASSAAALAFRAFGAAGRGHLQRRAGGAQRGQMALGTGAAAADGYGPGWLIGGVPFKYCIMTIGGVPP